MPQYEGKVNAPEFPPGLEWLNVREPLTLKSLRGKIVLLDFWTYCCINCMHIIPDLKRLEAKYPDELVVIGVHSAKFQNERDTHNILQAVLRYEIEHPVVNDSAMALWQQYTVRAWPTVVLIDPDGKVVGAHAGEGVFRAVDPAIAEMKASVRNRRPISLDAIANHVPQSLLSFPGKVLADDATNRLYIADTNHDRIVIADLDGDVIDVIDGFHHPQGMCLLDGKLYVADTGSDSVVALHGREIQTVAAGLNSPWDLAVRKGSIYIAMAGAHQIWKLDVGTGAAAPYAGSGTENIVDGPRETAALAQPSGITSDGEILFFADSETSSIRALNNEVVSTIVGRGLFDFGDRDGAGDDARLQHPLGVTFYQSEVFVADSYNNKVKRVSPVTREVHTVADGFAEPGGLSIARGKIYVADTNNHVIRIVDLQNPVVTTLMLQGLQKLKPPAPDTGWTGQTIQFASETVRIGDVKIEIAPKFPDGMKLNPRAPNRLLIRSESAAVTFEGDRPALLVDVFPDRPVEVNAKVTGNAGLKIMTQLYYCHAGDEGLCFYTEILASISLDALPDSSNAKVTLALPI